MVEPAIDTVRGFTVFWFRTRIWASRWVLCWAYYARNRMISWMRCGNLSGLQSTTIVVQQFQSIKTKIDLDSEFQASALKRWIFFLNGTDGHFPPAFWWCENLYQTSSNCLEINVSTDHPKESCQICIEKALLFRFEGFGDEQKPSSDSVEYLFRNPNRAHLKARKFRSTKWQILFTNIC